MAPYTSFLSKKQHTSRQVAARPSGQPSRGSPSRVTHRRRRKGWHLAEDSYPEGDGHRLQTRARCGSLTAFVRQRYRSDGAWQPSHIIQHWFFFEKDTAFIRVIDNSCMELQGNRNGWWQQLQQNMERERSSIYSAGKLVITQLAI